MQALVVVQLRMLNQQTLLLDGLMLTVTVDYNIMDVLLSSD